MFLIKSSKELVMHILIYINIWVEQIKPNKFIVSIKHIFMNDLFNFNEILNGSFENGFSGYRLHFNIWINDNIHNTNMRSFIAYLYLLFIYQILRCYTTNWTPYIKNIIFLKKINSLWIFTNKYPCTLHNFWFFL